VAALELDVGCLELRRGGGGAPPAIPADAADDRADGEHRGGDPDEHRRVRLRPGRHLPGECLELVGLA
jgi:hypothetical protein